MLPITHEQQQYPFQTIAMDLITDLPVSHGYDSILTIVDQGCTKAAVFLPCHKTMDAVGVASLYAQRVFPFYGVPRRVISDRDPRFTAQFVKELCRVLNISQNLSTAYHPQTDGQSKRANQRVEQYLSVRLKLAFCTTCAVCVLVLAQGPSFLRLRRALLRRREDLQDERNTTITSGGVEAIRRSCSTSTEENEVVWKW
jgi:hypothetical protein